MIPRLKFHEGLNFHSINQFLSHCIQTKNLASIQELYAHILRSGLFFISPNLQTEVVWAYTQCIDGNRLRILNYLLKSLGLRNPLPFNSIISHFSQNGPDCCSLHTLSFMHSNSVYIDSYALCSSVKSASHLKKIWLGKMMQAYAEKSGWLSSVFVGSALVDFHAKSLCMSDAAKVFDEIPVKNTVCVNALLSGYAEAKMWWQLIELIRRMPLLGLEVDNFTLSAALRACGGLCALEFGKQIHGNVVRSIAGVAGDAYLQSLLIEMYGKCGQLGNSKKIFSMGYGERQRDVVLWTSILSVCGRAGDYTEVITLFRDMVTEGVHPDGVAFLTVISACGHTGQVDLGLQYFESMTRDYGLIASQEHYSCIVDLLCRAGELERACRLISEMQETEDRSCSISMWGALLSACNECGDISLGKLAAERALELEPSNVGIYVLLSNMYAGNGMWAEIEQLREIMKKRGLKKELGWSWTDSVKSISRGR